jgi:hypothetical protein
MLHTRRGTESKFSLIIVTATEKVTCYFGQLNLPHELCSQPPLCPQDNAKLQPRLRFWNAPVTPLQTRCPWTALMRFIGYVSKLSRSHVHNAAGAHPKRRLRFCRYSGKCDVSVVSLYTVWICSNACAKTTAKWMPEGTQGPIRLPCWFHSSRKRRVCVIWCFWSSGMLRCVSKYNKIWTFAQRHTSTVSAPLLLSAI